MRLAPVVGFYLDALRHGGVTSTPLRSVEMVVDGAELDLPGGPASSPSPGTLRAALQSTSPRSTPLRRRRPHHA